MNKKTKKLNENNIKYTSLFRFGVCIDDGKVGGDDDGDVDDNNMVDVFISFSIDPFEDNDSLDFTISLTMCNFGGGYRGGDFVTSTKLSGTSTGNSRCGPKSYSGGPKSPDDDERVLNEPLDFV